MSQADDITYTITDKGRAVLAAAEAERDPGFHEPYEKTNGGLAYGPCCHAEQYPCLCRRHGDKIRAVGYHPIASQRFRDAVCLFLGYPPGSLVPVTNGTTVEMWDMEAGRSTCIHVMPVANWQSIRVIINDRDYDFQPPEVEQ